jgi:mRNA-degrading endonuclease RelE of RelBE toxin-antitoxin system
MNVQFTPRADRDYDNLSPRLQRAVDQQLNFLREKPENLRHPSIQAKKYSETDNIWQGRVTRSYRFYFQIVSDTYLILRITAHPK